MPDPITFLVGPASLASVRDQSDAGRFEVWRSKRDTSPDGRTYDYVVNRPPSGGSGRSLFHIWSTLTA